MLQENLTIKELNALSRIIRAHGTQAQSSNVIGLAGPFGQPVGIENGQVRELYTDNKQHRYMYDGIITKSIIDLFNRKRDCGA